MAEIVQSIEIARSPEDVFTYATDFSRFPEWQSSVISAQPQGDAPLAVGSRALVTRRAGPRRLAQTVQVTEFDPPRRSTVRGVGGPIEATAQMTLEPVADGARSRVTIALDFQGHGIGKLLRPLLRRQARKQLPRNVRKLQEQLERGPTARAAQAGNREAGA